MIWTLIIDNLSVTYVSALEFAICIIERGKYWLGIDVCLWWWFWTEFRVNSGHRRDRIVGGPGEFESFESTGVYYKPLYTIYTLYYHVYLDL